MNPATKAALYNALLFPGWGHIYLKKYKSGIAIIVSILAGMLSISWSIAQVALTILRTKPFNKGTVDINAVFNLSTETIGKMGKGIASPCPILLVLLFMVLLWVFSIIDAYQLGKKQMQQSTAPTKT
ncbi:MAG: hypothetical protein ABFD57_06540 [Smithella sp.]